MEQRDSAKPGRSTRVVTKYLKGDFSVDQNLNIVVACEDEQYVEVPRSQADVCAFIKRGEGEEEAYTFEGPAAVLETLVEWSEHYGFVGPCASPLTRPCVYRDFNFVFTDPWDKHFFSESLWSPSQRQNYLITMNVAEKYGMKGLLDFMAIGLGCLLRSESASVIMYEVMGLPSRVRVLAEDLEAVPEDYPWFEEATKPTVAQ